MELEQLKRLSVINVSSILSKRVDPLGTELQVATDSLKGMQKIWLSGRVEPLILPGLLRQQQLCLQLLADFKDTKKRNYMPIQYAKADDLVMEPIWRPAIFSLNNFKLTSSASAPASNNIIPRVSGNFSLNDDERLVITDIVECGSQEGWLEFQFKVDDDQQYVFSARPSMKVGDIRIHELDYPIVCDVSLDWDGRSETASVEMDAMPCGVHICKATLLKAISAGA